jgi:hypothetical protein
MAKKRIAHKLSPFKTRYVLGQGFPWVIGLNPYTSIGLTANKVGVQYRPLTFANELWRKDVPKYRLVLERVQRGGRR